MPLVVLASALLGILGVLVAFRARLARRAVTVRRELGEPQRFDPDARTGTKVCVDGTVCGARVSSWSGVAAEPAPAKLALEIDGSLLPIRGRAAVLVGSVETVPRTGRALRTLRVGDRVRVRATIVRDGSDLCGGGYRDGRSAIGLEAFDDRGIVELAYLGGPRPARLGLSRWAFGTFAGAITGVLASLGALYTHRPPPPVPIVRDDFETPVKKPMPRDCSGDVDFGNGELEKFTKGDDESSLFGACALRRAEASLALHQWKKAAAAVRALAASSGESPHDRERREALECIARAIDHRADERAPFVPLGRAMCIPLQADSTDDPELRIARLGNVSWVWGDAQGMEFAKGPVARMSHAMLLELGRPETTIGRYGFYPEAYLARNDPGSTVPYTFEHFEGGDDVARLAWEGKRTIDGLPFAIFSALSKAGKPSASDPPDTRMYVHGNLALFLAATNDREGAAAEFRALDGIPDETTSHAPYWTRPTVASVKKAMDELESGAPAFRMHGEIWSALEQLLARERMADSVTYEPAIRRFRWALLDREIAVPLYFLETFARR